MYIGIDLGGTSCRIAGIADLQNLTELTKKDFRLMHDFDRDFATLKKLIHEISLGNVDGIGIGTPGSFDAEKTTITSNAQNIPEWINKPIKKLLEETFLCPVSLDNDAVTAALGEAYADQRKREIFVYIIWGTGIGGATVAWHNDKAEVKKLDWYKYLESWENACGGKVIQTKFGKPAEALSENEWQEIMKAFAKEFLLFYEKLTIPLIIFGGGIAIKQASRLLQINHPNEVTIQISTHGEDTGLYGALCLLKTTT